MPFIIITQISYLRNFEKLWTTRWLKFFSSKLVTNFCKFNYVGCIFNAFFQNVVDYHYTKHLIPIENTHVVNYIGINVANYIGTHMVSYTDSDPTIGST